MHAWMAEESRKMTCRNVETSEWLLALCDSVDNSASIYVISPCRSFQHYDYDGLSHTSPGKSDELLYRITVLQYTLAMHNIIHRLRADLYLQYICHTSSDSISGSKHAHKKFISLLEKGWEGKIDS